MVETLVEWLRKLEAHNLLQRISQPVSIHEVADIIASNYLKATLIEKIEGFNIPLVANISSNRKMIALALGVEESEVIEELERRMMKRTRPVFVDYGPCKEVVKLGDDVDLTIFPLYL